MKITKDKDNLIVSIPLKQEMYNPYMDESVGEMDNLVGVIAGDFEQGFYNLNDMDYKGKPPQLGMQLVTTYMEDDEFRKLCKELCIMVWEYEQCAKCFKTLWGSHTFSKEGSVCMECGE